MRISKTISYKISKAISKKKEDLEGVLCCPRNPPPITNRYTIRPYEGSVKCLGGSQRSVVLMGNISGPYGKNFARPLTKRPSCGIMQSKITRIRHIYIRYQSYSIRYLPINIRYLLIYIRYQSYSIRNKIIFTYNTTIIL